MLPNWVSDTLKEFLAPHGHGFEQPVHPQLRLCTLQQHSGSPAALMPVPSRHPLIKGFRGSLDYDWRLFGIIRGYDGPVGDYWGL